MIQGKGAAGASLCEGVLVLQKAQAKTPDLKLGVERVRAE